MNETDFLIEDGETKFLFNIDFDEFAKQSMKIKIESVTMWAVYRYGKYIAGKSGMVEVWEGQDYGRLFHFYNIDLNPEWQIRLPFLVLSFLHVTS